MLLLIISPSDYSYQNSSFIKSLSCSKYFIISSYLQSGLQPGIINPVSPVNHPRSLHYSHPNTNTLLSALSSKQQLACPPSHLLVCTPLTRLSFIQQSTPRAYNLLNQCSRNGKQFMTDIVHSYCWLYAGEGGSTMALKLSCRTAKAKSSVDDGAITTGLGGCQLLFH